MEFSEAYELNDLLKFSPGLRNRKSTILSEKNTLSLLETMMGIGLDLEEKFLNSPQDLIPDQLTYYTEYATEPIEPVKPEEKPADLGPVVLQVTRDDNFRETYAQSLCKVSILSESLKSDFTTKPTQGYPILVYLFSTQNCIKVILPKKATIEQVPSRVISAYLKDERLKNEPLPFGPIAEAYEIRMVDEVTLMPELDFMIEKSMRVKDLDVKSLGFITKPGYSDSKSSVIPLLKESSGKGRQIKIYFEKSCNIVQISEESTVKKILEVLSVKFGYLNPEEYEFKVAVQVEELTEQECDVSMDLKIHSLTSEELRLYRKVYADTPSMIENNKKEIPIFKEAENVIFDPSRINMTRAQAIAYKEYEVIKTNPKGKRQKRILGIDQLRLLNMTVKQAKDKVIKGKALEKSEKNIFKKKLQSILSSVAQHPEIPISKVHCVEQDPKNLSCFYIEYTEGGTKKKKLYETEKSNIAVEIISKISKLMSLVRII